MAGYEKLSCEEIVTQLVVLFDEENQDELDELFDWWLFSYSPENRWSTFVTNSTALRDEDLREAIMTKAVQFYEPSIFLEALNLLASLDSNEIPLAKAGAVKQCIMAMARDASSARSQVLGCKILACLATHPEIRNFIGKPGISRILSSLKAHPNDNSVIHESLIALTNLGYHSKSNRNIMIMNQAVDVVMSVLKVHQNVPDIVARGLCFLRTLSFADFLERIEEFHGHQIGKFAIHCITAFKINGAVQENAIWVLVNLMSKRVDIKLFLHELGLGQIILETMELHRGQLSVQIAGATCIAIICKIKQIRDSLMKFRVLELLYSSLCLYTSSEELQQSGIKCFFRLGFNKEARDLQATLGIIQQISKVMEIHKNPKLLCSSILTLQKLSQSTKCKELVTTHGLAQILKIQQKFPELDHLQNLAKKAIQILMDPSTTTDEIKEEDRTKSFQQLLTEIASLKGKLKEANGKTSNLQKQIDKEEDRSKSLQQILTEIASFKGKLKEANGKTSNLQQIDKINGENTRINLVLSQQTELVMKLEEDLANEKAKAKSRSRSNSRRNSKPPPVENKEVVAASPAALLGVTKHMNFFKKKGE